MFSGRTTCNGIEPATSLHKKTALIGNYYIYNIINLQNKTLQKPHYRKDLDLRCPQCVQDPVPLYIYFKEKIGQQPSIKTKLAPNY